MDFEFKVELNGKEILIKEGALLSFKKSGKNSDTNNYIIVDIQRKPLLSRVGAYTFDLFCIETDGLMDFRYNKNDILSWLNHDGELTSIV